MIKMSKNSEKYTGNLLKSEIAEQNDKTDQCEKHKICHDHVVVFLYGICNYACNITMQNIIPHYHYYMKYSIKYTHTQD